MNNKIGRVVNIAIGSLGMRLSRSNTISTLLEQLELSQKRNALGLENVQRNSTLVAEVENLLRELLFPNLPSCEGRRELLAQLYGTSVTEAIYLLEYLYRSLRRDGDVCEFGVAQGATSALIANEIRSTEKILWLFDSFEGLPMPSEKDELIDDIFDLKTIENYKGTMACPIEMVESNLNAIQFPPERAKIIPGFVEETFGRPDLPERICFAYVDFDFYEPILTTLRFLHERLAPRGYIMVDDYGFFSSGAKTAVDEFVDGSPGIYELSFPCKSAGKFCVLHKTW